MRKGQRELDFVRYGVSVASSLQRCPHGCSASSKSSPSYTEGIHNDLESSDGSIEEPRSPPQVLAGPKWVRSVKRKARSNTRDLQSRDREDRKHFGC